MKIYPGILIFSLFIASCSGSYNRNFNPDKQWALIYLGDKAGNRMLFLNYDKFSKIDIHRKRNSDSTFIQVKSLKINKISLRFKVGNHGPGFAYNWNDPDDFEITTRYKVIALDDSSNFLVELKNLHSIRDENGKWKYIQDE